MPGCSPSAFFFISNIVPENSGVRHMRPGRRHGDVRISGQFQALPRCAFVLFRALVCGRDDPTRPRGLRLLFVVLRLGLKKLLEVTLKFRLCHGAAPGAYGGPQSSRARMGTILERKKKSEVTPWRVIFDFAWVLSVGLVFVGACAAAAARVPGAARIAGAGVV